MPTNTSQSRQAPHSLVLGPFGGGIGKTITSEINRASNAISTSVARFYCPAFPLSQGLVVRGVRAWMDAEVGSADATMDVLNGQTTVLNAAMTLAGVTMAEATLANNGTEFVDAGNYLRVSATETSGGTWDSTNQASVWVQIDYDLI